MSASPTRMHGILHMKCPYCREGQFFVSHPYDLAHVGDVLDECPVCRRNYNIEYGFFMGAMYLGYGLSTVVGFTTYLLMAFLFPSVWFVWQIVVVGLAVLLAAPLMYAYSKVIYGNIFLPFKGPSDPNYRPVRRKDAWK